MSSPYFPARTVLFEREEGGVTYRIPALLYLPKRAILLAFAEERLSPDDSHANVLVLRRGAFYRTYVEWGDMRVVKTASLEEHRSMNPCPVYDELTGTVFLFFIAVLGNTPESFQIMTGKNAARLCYVTSSDGGLTWSAVTDLTEQVIGSVIEDWATFALGPGHGIQLRSGRLLIPAYTYHIDCKECFGKICKTTPHSFTFYSDDHGQSWQFGDFIPNLKTGECQLVNVYEEDGSNVLYCNARSPLGCRVQALSMDDGAAFLPGQLVRKLVESNRGCHGSIVGFPAPLVRNSSHFLSQGERWFVGCDYSHFLQKLQRLQKHKGESPVTSVQNAPQSRPQQKISAAAGGSGQTAPGPVSPSSTTSQTPTWVLYSHPTSHRSRVNMGVYLSTFPRNADSWTKPWVIYEGPSAYSDLAAIELPFSEPAAPGIPAITFACLYESGARYAYEEISFCLFTLSEVIENIPIKASSLSQSCQAGNKNHWKSCVIS
ncbi:sialidase-4 [Dromiciops gliroides]|uniref:sialidase-4 n=1 Tax=Dromiciops gliroides TaxID=33562 RepID=UPI001CC82E38|nr:sialidase-4 [Dromiciops gliroides]XP_043852299.1 sialidase-4 [Dromiciops gliroides]XP_043852300.1 sialidase-4 [Dromiciops gliroides]